MKDRRTLSSMSWVIFQNQLKKNSNSILDLFNYLGQPTMAWYRTHAMPPLNKLISIMCPYKYTLVQERIVLQSIDVSIDLNQTNVKISGQLTCQTKACLQLITDSKDLQFRPKSPKKFR